MTTTPASITSLNASLGRPVRILLVEDSPSDVAMTLAALEESRIANEVTVVRDGEQALDQLRGVGDFEGSEHPDLVILDLNLPRMDGRELLARVKGDPALSSIPVIVLTSSASDADVVRSYQLRANSYITKPVDVDGFFDAVKSFENFWLAIVRLPE